MRKTLITFYLSVFLLHVSQPVFAGSAVWKIEKGNSKIYIGGTVHVLSKKDYPLPKPYEKAYKDSGVLVFETNLNEMKTPAFQQKMLSHVVYGEGQSLKTTLNPETLALLETHLASRGLPMSQLEKLKPGMLAATLTVMELQRHGLAGTGVDEFFNNKAMNDQKQVLGLETVDQQLKFIASMGLGQENELIRYTLRDLDDLPTVMNALKSVWRSGDMATMNKEYILPFKKDFPKIHHQLISERNHNWIPAIKKMFETKETEFILVGALHLPGSDGILSILESLGYKVERI